LPSADASWIAVMGRQNNHLALSVQTAINVSEAAMNDSA
jgi:hypothetical protein